MRTIVGLAAVATLVLATVLYSAGVTRAQSAGGGNRPAANGGPGRGGRFRGNPQQFFQRMQQRMLDRIKKQLKVTGDVWTVLKPRVQKVQQLVFQNRMSHFMGGPGGRRGRLGRGRGPGMFNSSTNPVVAAEQKLRTTLRDPNAKASQIKAALAALQQARADAKAKLNAARGNLRQLLTIRQEADLVLDGLLNY